MNWCSACELGVFLATGDSCIKTELTTKTFSAKGIYMMFECQRVLNNASSAEGLLLPRCSTQTAKPTSMDAFLVPKPSDSDSDAEGDTCHEGHFVFYSPVYVNYVLGISTHMQYGTGGSREPPAPVNGCRLCTEGLSNRIDCQTELLATRCLLKLSGKTLIRDRWDCLLEQP